MRTRLLRWSTVVTSGMLFGGIAGGGCLPDDFFVGEAGAIASAVFNAFVTTPILGYAGI